MNTPPQQRLRAVSIAPRGQRWLADTRQAYVLYAFERVVNLVNQDGEVLSIAQHQIGNGPFSLRLETGPFPNKISVDTKLLVFENGLWMDDWLIDAEEATVWNPTPKWDPSSDGKTRNWARAILAQLLNEYAEPDSLARLVLDPAAVSPLPARIIQAAEQHIPLLIQGIEGAGKLSIAKASKGLAGIGPGLTPAGDDFLLGVMHGVWASRSTELARELCAQIAKAAVPRTHTLSAAWLQAGAAGEAGEPWHELVLALSQSDETNLRAAVMAILPTGHTSGSDALGGFLSVLNSSV